MKGRFENDFLEGKRCTVFSKEGVDSAGTCPMVYALCGDELLVQLPEILTALPRECPPFRLCWFGPAAWNRDYSPWPGEALSKSGEPFSGGGPDTLVFLLDKWMPLLKERYPISENLLLGYSLGGLTALWALCETACFSGCASCSGSLWYEGWLPYLKGHLPRPGSRVYLSLGRSEEKARNSRMAQVGEATRETFSLLRGTPGVETALEWQDGGHFHQIPQRLAKGICWLLEGKIQIDREKSMSLRY